MAKTLRFIIVPKVAHPWFDDINKGARAQAEILSQALDAEIAVGYMPPSIAGVAEQNGVLEKATGTRPSGIAVDPIDAVGNMTVIKRIKDQGIPVILFDSPSPDASFHLRWQQLCPAGNYCGRASCHADRVRRQSGRDAGCQGTQGRGGQHGWDQADTRCHKGGVIESSSATIPGMQGSMSILMLWQASLGIHIPQAIDTGIDVITQENVDRYLAAVQRLPRAQI